MKRHERDHLLNEILGSDEVSGFRQTSLDQGLAAFRKARSRRRAGRTGALVALPVLLAAAVFVHQWPGSTGSSVPSVSSVPVAGPAIAPPRATPSVKFITDEELFAIFPNRSLALIGPPGHQQLVFLDRGGGTKSARGM
jgi:hypothetical protein